MTLMILGLVIFLGVHSVRIFAEGWRNATRARQGENAWKGLYSIASIAGFVLIVVGFGRARLAPVLLWLPMPWTHHVAALLVLVAFVLLAAAYVPGNGIKARLHHPMVLGVAIWAFAHLLANIMLADLILFGSFLVWAALDLRAARRRDRAAGTEYAPGRAGRTALTVVIGVAAWVFFAHWGHEWLIGTKPFG